MLGIWLTSRLLMYLLAASTAVWFARGPVPPYALRWFQWDVAHFTAIARLGYTGPGTNPIDVAFFPGLPTLLALGHEVTGWQHATVGLLVSLLAGAVAAVALGRLGDLDGPPGTGRRAVLLWVLAPPAVFLAAPYSEPLFLGLALPAWLAARTGRWASAGVLAALSCTVRVSGLFLAAALLVQWLTAPAGPRRVRDLGWLALPALPLAGWSVYLWSATGDWLAWVHAQKDGWYRTLQWPWQALRTTVVSGVGQPDPAVAWMFRAEIVAVAVGVVLTGVLLWRRRWGEATWVGLNLAALATSVWFISVTRSVVLWWPLFVVLAVAAARHRAVVWVYVAVCGPLMVVWATMFLTARWAG